VARHIFNKLKVRGNIPNKNKTAETAEDAETAEGKHVLMIVTQPPHLQNARAHMDGNDRCVP